MSAPQDSHTASGPEATAKPAEPMVIRADAALLPDRLLSDPELEFDSDGRISYIGEQRSTSTVTHNLSGHILMPGLSNGHTHSAMSLLRGASDDDGLMPWLEHVQSMEQLMTHADVAVGLQLAMLEMIETGTVAFADMYYWDAALLELVKSAGMRVFASPAAVSPEVAAFPGVSAATGDEMCDLTESLAAEYAGDPQIRIAFGPHAPYTCPTDFLRDIVARSKRSGIPINTHIAESAAEVATIAERYGASPVTYLESLGLFDVDVLGAHCVHMSTDEVAMFARTGTAVSHNPVSNLKLGTGVAPLPDMLDSGVRLALGTDSVASNNTLDLFEEIKVATILQRGTREAATAMRASDVVDIATTRGADAIGFPESGAIEVGRMADVIALSTGSTSSATFDPRESRAALVSHLGFTATGADVRHVFIGGRHVYRDGKHLTLDAERIRQRARAAADRLRVATQ
ncbi:MAG: amidohydrolase [Leucobacter sp.]